MNKLVSFNCKSVKRSVESIRELCKTSDIIALQETWLWPHDLCFLADIDKEFGYTGTSAIDTAVDLFRGRPYGGVALLWKKSVFNIVSVVNCDNTRLCAIKIKTENRQFIVFSVYMPTNSIDNLSLFTECLGQISAIVEEQEVAEVFILGDFNAHPGELFGEELSNFCKDQEWIWVDGQFLGVDSDSFTYISEAHGCRRWLDHCLATQAAYRSVQNVKIEHNVLWSDHFPLSIECDLTRLQPKLVLSNDSNNNNMFKIRWGERKAHQIESYYNYCNEKLKYIDFPEKLITCNSLSCDNVEHRRILSDMYCEIISILCMAAVNSYESKPVKKKKYITGWNRYVSGAHKSARQAFQHWVLVGKPLSGYAHKEMCDTRKYFKSRLKWCQDNEDQIKMDIIALHHSNGKFRDFWKHTKRCNPKPSLPVSVNGESDPQKIANLFSKHFRVDSPLSSVNNEQFDVEPRLSTGHTLTFSVKDVARVIKSMKRGKSPGHDGLSIEHLQHAGQRGGNIYLGYSVCFLNFVLCIRFCHRN
ncbi:uncharacterized protein LOC134750846 [Cydia strobilella]|uniref:uncharacterized protein LOC134750846 n=1 Tax=Cydia strobilella TaxID=1100964 RepID=UPI0030072AC3